MTLCRFLCGAGAGRAGYLAKPECKPIVQLEGTWRRGQHCGGKEPVRGLLGGGGGLTRRAGLRKRPGQSSEGSAGGTKGVSMATPGEVGLHKGEDA